MVGLRQGMKMPKGPWENFKPVKDDKRNKQAQEALLRNVLAFDKKDVQADTKDEIYTQGTVCIEGICVPVT